jgi:hypothetical protein
VNDQLAVLEKPDDLEVERTARMPAEFYVWKNEGGAFLPGD